MIVWLTGLPCSGKTTIGKVLVGRLQDIGRKAELLDGDEIRHALWPELGFSKDARETNVLRFAYLANMLVRQGSVAVVATVSPYREHRDSIRKAVVDHCVDAQFIEVFVDAPLVVCGQRDVKGMYRRSFVGGIEGFTGVSDPYEPPLAPDVHCLTAVESVGFCVEKILQRCGVTQNDTQAATGSPWPMQRRSGSTYLVD